MNFRKQAVTLMSVLFASIFLVYIANLFSLQIVKGGEFRDRARRISQRTTVIPARRGDIYDRLGDSPFVTNTDAFTVEIVPALVPRERLRNVIDALASALSLSEEKIREKLEQGGPVNRAVEIARKVPARSIYYLAEHNEDFPGVVWRTKPLRWYLETGSLAHVLGYVNEITVEELQILYNKGYKAGDIIGKRGIEKQYDSLLRGEDGAEYRTVDVSGRMVKDGSQPVFEPKPGHDLVLTIDRKIQRLSEKALGPRVGAVVVLQPATGEILAQVSYPWFDPNIFYSDREGVEFDRLSLDPSYPFLNRVIQSTYPPASAFKIIMTTGLIEEKAVELDMTVECTGSHWLGGRQFKCWLESGHGELALFEALAQSCNIYFQTVGLNYLGIDLISNYMHLFGLGELSGVDLPGEVAGIAPTPMWKEQVRDEPWTGGDTFNTSIGQGYTLVTPIQMANAVAMIVNEGVVYQPRILKQVREPGSYETVLEPKPKVLRTSPISRETFRQVKGAMRGVITDGTAQVVITTKAVEIAGKTGTAEVGSDESWDSWFVAYGPVGGSPEETVVVVTLVESVNEWEWWAPKAANIIFQGIFADQTYEEAVEALSPLWYLPWPSVTD